MMGKLQDFLLNNKPQAAGEIEVVVSKRFLDKDGAPIPFKIRAISEAENKKIRNSCQRTTINKKTHQKETETDTNAYMNKIVIESTVDPNFKDASLQEKMGVMGAEALLDTLLLPGEYAELLAAVQEVNGFNDDFDDLRAEAKNS